MTSSCWMHRILIVVVYGHLRVSNVETTEVDKNDILVHDVLVTKLPTSDLTSPKIHYGGVDASVSYNRQNMIGHDWTQAELASPRNAYLAVSTYRN